MRASVAVLLALGLWTLAAGARDITSGEKKGEAHGQHMGPRAAVAVLHGLGKNHDIRGVIHFQVIEDGIEITGQINGLPPGEHAFHVHEFGDCSSEDGMSAGAHFNPEHKHHGSPEAEQRHVGDLGNIKADDNGRVNLNLKDRVIQLHGPHSIIGRSLIVHAQRDDFTDPAGNAGARIACGVIGIAKGGETAPK